jgi:transposase-like protein
MRDRSVLKLSQRGRAEKLTEADKQEAKELVKTYTMSSVAKYFGVSRNTIHKAVSGAGSKKTKTTKNKVAGTEKTQPKQNLPATTPFISQMVTELTPEQVEQVLAKRMYNDATIAEELRLPVALVKQAFKDAKEKKRHAS